MGDRYYLALGVLLVASACGGKTQLEVEEALLCVEVPLGEPPTHLDASFEAQLRSAEVMLLIDQTGSMDGEIAQIREGLVSDVIPEMRDAFANLRLGIAGFGDFPMFPYGVAGDLPFVMYQPITGDTAAIQRAAEALLPDTFYGNDEPEAQIPALNHLATNLGYPTYIDPVDCPAGTEGAACFGEAARVVLLFTDASFHNGPGDVWPYGYPLPSPPASYDETVVALNDAGVRVIVLWSGDPDAAGPAIAIAGDTGARDADGQALVFDIGLEGEGLDRGVVGTIRDLVDGALLEVDAVPVDVPSDAVDATTFVRAISSFRALPEEGARIAGAGFTEVRPGTRLTFRITLANERFEARAEPQIYPLDVYYRDRGLAALDTERVYIVVPSTNGIGCEALRR